MSATPSHKELQNSNRLAVVFRHALAWITVRPRRWFFAGCLAFGSFGVRWLPERREVWDAFDHRRGRPRRRLEMIRWPNVHWVLGYRTVFAFFRWVYHRGWRKLCKWGPRVRETYPWYARIVHRIGQTTVGAAISGGECFHCASVDGDPVDLCNDETGTTFILESYGTAGTPDGTDYWFRGTAICPKCGHRTAYSDGSL